MGANGQASSQVVKCQDGKKFIIPYVVYEKTFPCNSYPPDENVTFFDISVECDGKDCTQEMQWSAHVKDVTCDTSASSRYDNLDPKALAMINGNGWAAPHAK